MAEEMRKGKHGKKNDQKMKPYLVYEYLMRHSDANHVVSANELVGYLQECGVLPVKLAGTHKNLRLSSDFA